MNGTPETTKSESTPAAEADVQSDPAKDAGDGTDWSDEGGATPPADD